MQQVTRHTAQNNSYNNAMQTKNVSRVDLHIQTKPIRFTVIIKNYDLIKTVYCKHKTIRHVYSTITQS